MKTMISPKITPRLKPVVSEASRIMRAKPWGSLFATA